VAVGRGDPGGAHRRRRDTAGTRAVRPLRRALLRGRWIDVRCVRHRRGGSRPLARRPAGCAAHPRPTHGDADPARRPVPRPTARRDHVAGAGTDRHSRARRRRRGRNPEQSARPAGPPDRRHLAAQGDDTGHPAAGACLGGVTGPDRGTGRRDEPAPGRTGHRDPQHGGRHRLPMATERARERAGPGGCTHAHQPAASGRRLAPARYPRGPGRRRTGHRGTAPPGRCRIRGSRRRNPVHRLLHRQPRRWTRLRRPAMARLPPSVRRNCS
jgi:hypothetical protein